MPGLVVGYDGSPSAREALRVALRLGRELAQPVTAAFGFSVNPVGGEVLDYRDAVAEHGRGMLADVASDAEAAGVPVETVIVEEDPAHALVDLARERDARAIVVGTRGEGPLRGALVGSTPHKLLQLADRPVLVVPEPPADGAAA